MKLWDAEKKCLANSFLRIRTYVVRPSESAGSQPEVNTGWVWFYPRPSVGRVKQIRADSSRKIKLQCWAWALMAYLLLTLRGRFLCFLSAWWNPGVQLHVWRDHLSSYMMSNIHIGWNLRYLQSSELLQFFISVKKGATRNFLDARSGSQQILVAIFYLC